VNSMVCPLCESCACHQFIRVDDRDYWRCEACEVTFLEPDQRPGAESELAEYQQHNNDPGDKGYRQFLMRVAEPLLEKLPLAQKGLDYGCGPGPALAELLRDAGHSVALYDPFFYPNPQSLLETYDFITCTEVAEHFHQPALEFKRLDKLLNPGGWLAIMTCFQTDDSRFANWHYRRDPTHVIFYREWSLRKLALNFGWQCEIPCPNVALMRKIC
jgi:SAM-dependent methyltransferase